MPNLDELSLRKIIELILDFYEDPCGYLEDEVANYPEVNEFITEGYDVLEGERYILSEAGEHFLHEYIKDISEKFIQYIRERNYELPFSEIANWFYEEYDLESEEDGEDIASYICENLCHYGYGYGKVYSSREGERYQFHILQNASTRNENISVH